MENLELKAEFRHITGKQVKRLRRDGLVPAVLYGKNLEPVLLQIEAKTLGKVLGEAGTHQLIALQIGNTAPQVSLARSIQRDVIRQNYTHVDFYVVDMGKKITAMVPLVLEGVAPAVEDKGGILTHSLNEVEIECLPQDLIPAIKVDLSSLVDLNDTITVADLKVSSSITILSDPESMVAKIEPPRLEEELPAPEEEAAEPEVVGRVREEKGEASGRERAAAEEE